MAILRTVHHQIWIIYSYRFEDTPPKGPLKKVLCLYWLILTLWLMRYWSPPPSATSYHMFTCAITYNGTPRFSHVPRCAMRAHIPHASSGISGAHVRLEALPYNRTRDSRGLSLWAPPETRSSEIASWYLPTPLLHYPSYLDFRPWGIFSTGTHAASHKSMLLPSEALVSARLCHMPEGKRGLSPPKRDIINFRGKR